MVSAAYICYCWICYSRDQQKRFVKGEKVSILSFAIHKVSVTTI
jgi:hypothetical protein